MDFQTPEGKIEQLHTALGKGEGEVVLLVHDYPDPDCIASALGLQVLLQHWEIPALIAHGGGMGRPENKAMVGLLDIALCLVADLPETGLRGAVLVDTQPGAGNNSLPDNLSVLGVIDHHPVQTEDDVDVLFRDVRPETCAGSTIVLEYLQAAGVAVDARLATALLLGIKTDSDNLEREASADDLASYAALLPVADGSLVRKVSRPPLPDEYFTFIQVALTDACRFGEALVANVGSIEVPDLLSAISDMLIRAKETAWALAVGWHKGKVYMSLRIRPPRKNAGNILRKTVANQGRGGGHGLAAGGQIEPANGDCENAAIDAIRRFLQAVGMADESPRPLCKKRRRLRRTAWIEFREKKGG